MRPDAQGGEGLFAYGTLAVPEVLEALAGGRRRGSPATLPDHACYRLRGRIYPAAVARAGAVTQGVFWEPIDAATWCILDDFEGDAYQRYSRTVRLAGGSVRQAFVYLLRGDREHDLTSQEWRLEEFVRREAPRYVAFCRAFRSARSPTGARGKGRT